MTNADAVVVFEASVVSSAFVFCGEDVGTSVVLEGAVDGDAVVG